MRNMIYSFFDNPRIAGEIKDFVKAKQRVGKDVYSKKMLENQMTYRIGRSFDRDRF